MHIRKATPADADLLSTLNVDVQKLHADAYPHIFKQPDDPHFASAFLAEQLQDENCVFYIAEVDDEAVGYIWLRIIRRPETPYMHAWSMIHIDHISLKPEYRGQGIGAALMQKARDLAQEQDIPRLVLDRWAFNENAHAFFLKQGFEVYNYRLWANLD